MKFELNKNQASGGPIRLPELLAAAVWAAAFCAAAVPAFPSINANRYGFIAIGAALAVIFVILISVKKIGRYVVPAVSFGVLLAFFVRFRFSRSGLLTLANDWLTFLTGRTGRIHLRYETGNLGVRWVAALYLILIALIIAHAVKRRRFVVLLLLLTATTAGLVIGFFKNDTLSLILLATSAALGVLIGWKPSAAPGKQTSRKSDSPVGSAAQLIPLLLALALGLLLCLVPRLFAGESSLSTRPIRESVQRAAHERRYENGNDRILPEGRLKQKTPDRFDSDVEINGEAVEADDEIRGANGAAGGVPTDSDAPLLEVTMSHPGKLYLRGFTADTYKDSVWSGVDAQTYIDNEARFYTLHDNDFYGQTMIAGAARAAGNYEDPQAESGEITVRNLGACRYWQYVPYALEDTSVPDKMMIGDAGIMSTESSASADANTYAVIPGSLPEWYAIELDLAAASGRKEARDYLQLEQAYYEYVLETDRQLSEEAASVCATLYGEESAERRLSDILELVRTTLDEKITYTESNDLNYVNQETAGTSGKDGLSGDVVKDVLTKTHAGYDIHYASAAVASLRYLGVPARYVEGFYLPADEAAMYASGDTISLTADHAHAWAEFYLRGIGWLPFETTPGYLDDEEDSLVALISSSAENTSGTGTLFLQTEIVYTSGVQEDQPLINRPKMPKWKPGPVFWIILGLLVLAFLLIILLWPVSRRRRHYVAGLEQMRSAKASGDHNLAVALNFAYASFLIQEAELTSGSETDPANRSDTKKTAREIPDGYDDMIQLNELARFSTRKLTSEDTAKAEAFTAAVIAKCCEVWSRGELLKNHLWRWIV